MKIVINAKTSTNITDEQYKQVLDSISSDIDELVMNKLTDLSLTDKAGKISFYDIDINNISINATITLINK